MIVRYNSAGDMKLKRTTSHLKNGWCITFKAKLLKRNNKVWTLKEITILHFGCVRNNDYPRGNMENVCRWDEKRK